MGLLRWELRALRGSLPGAERPSSASAGIAAVLRVKRSLGIIEGVMSANLHTQDHCLALCASGGTTQRRVQFVRRLHL